MFKLVIVFLIFIVLDSSCLNFKKMDTNIEIKDFNCDLWRYDSIACNGYRASAVKTLIDNKNLIIGHSQEQVLLFFGEPNVKKNSQRYFIERSVQCLGFVDGDGFDSLEVKSLIVEYDYNKFVKDIRIIAP